MIIPDILFNGTVKSALDVGANVGHWSQAIRRQKPDVDLFMIEGNPSCLPMLQYTQIPFKIACLSNVEKRVKMYTNKNNDVCTGVSYYLEQTHHYTEDTFIEVDTKLLDDVILTAFGEHKAFDYIKLDTQGSERDIIEGGMRTIKNAKFVQIELSIIQYNKDSILKAEMIDHMKSIGFYPNMLIERLHWENNPSKELIQEDWLFGREEVVMQMRPAADVYGGLPQVIIE